jgi:hypothetical protein
MSADRDDEIIAAYGAGEEVGQIGRRFGLSREEVSGIVAGGVGTAEAPHGPASASPPARGGPLAAAGVALIVLGVFCPFSGGVLWLMTYYVSDAEYPVASWGYGNLAVGFSGVCIGLALAMIGLVLWIVSRAIRRP